MHIFEIEALLKNQGEVTLPLGSSSITLDLSKKHERNYAAKLLLNIRYPQSDIDTKIFQKIISPGDRVLDAGANIGFTALEMIEVGASSVLAVEPVPEIYQRLSLIKHQSITPLNCAISSKSGRALITISESHNQGSSISPEILRMFPAVFGSSPATMEIDACTIDDICTTHGNMDVWKLDIEGAEVDALEGAHCVLKTSPPRIIVAELYDAFFPSFAERISSTHPFSYRALLSKNDYKLSLLPSHHNSLEAFEPTSPMYIFSRSALR